MSQHEVMNDPRLPEIFAKALSNYADIKGLTDNEKIAMAHVDAIGELTRIIKREEEELRRALAASQQDVKPSPLSSSMGEEDLTAIITPQSPAGNNCWARTAARILNHNETDPGELRELLIGLISAGAYDELLMTHEIKEEILGQLRSGGQPGEQVWTILAEFFGHTFVVVSMRAQPSGRQIGSITVYGAKFNNFNGVFAYHNGDSTTIVIDGETHALEEPMGGHYDLGTIVPAGTSGCKAIPCVGWGDLRVLRASHFSGASPPRLASHSSAHLGAMRLDSPQL